MSVVRKGQTATVYDCDMKTASLGTRFGLRSRKYQIDGEGGGSRAFMMRKGVVGGLEGKSKVVITEHKTE